MLPQQAILVNGLVNGSLMIHITTGISCLDLDMFKTLNLGYTIKLWPVASGFSRVWIIYQNKGGLYVIGEKVTIILGDESQLLEVYHEDIDAFWVQLQEIEVNLCLVWSSWFLDRVDAYSDHWYLPVALARLLCWLPDSVTWELNLLLQVRC